MSTVYNNVLELIGNTPMVKLNTVTKDVPAKVFAKLESFNPGHSTKDRIALHIIEAAEKKGILKPGATIVETTSGNTGFSIAKPNMSSIQEQGKESWLTERDVTGSVCQVSEG